MGQIVCSSPCLFSAPTATLHIAASAPTSSVGNQTLAPGWLTHSMAEWHRKISKNLAHIEEEEDEEEVVISNGMEQWLAFARKNTRTFGASKQHFKLGVASSHGSSEGSELYGIPNAESQSL